MMNQKVDFLIVGGGVMGLATAWRLSQAGKKIVLVEKGACGSGASLASLGALMPYSPWHDKPLANTQRESLWMYPDFVNELFMETGINPQLRKTGRIQFLASQRQREQYEAGIPRAISTWKYEGSGEVMSLLSKTEAEMLEPEIECGEFGAVQCQATGHIRVEFLIAALRSACMKRGVDIRENSVAHKLITEDDVVLGAETATGAIYATTTVLAAGAWCKKLLYTALPQHKFECASDEEIKLVTPVKGQVIMLQSEKPLLKHLLRGLGIYIVPVDGNKYLVGATKEGQGLFDTSIDDDGCDKLLAKAEALVPALAEAKMVKQWAGLRPKSESKIPVVEASEHCKNLFIITGHGGIGICMLPGASKLAAELLL